MPSALIARAITRSTSCRRIGDAGGLGAHLEANPQGPGTDFIGAIRAMTEAGRVCGSTSFMMWCHDVCGLYMEQSGNPALTGLRLDAHARGATMSGTGMSNPMKTFARIESMLLKAKPVPGGYRVSGTLPWVSHIAKNHYLGAVAAVVDTTGQVADDQHEVMFLLDCDAPGVELRHCPTFSAMEGTSTWSVRLTDVLIDADHVIADPVRPFIARIRAAFILLQTGMGLGVAQGSIDSMWLVEDQLGHVNALLDDRPYALQAELDDLTTRIEALALTPYATGNDYLIDVRRARPCVRTRAARRAVGAAASRGPWLPDVSGAAASRARVALRRDRDAGHQASAQRNGAADDAGHARRLTRDAMSALPSAIPRPADKRPWRRFICRACGYLYDERDGDPDGGLVPGTRYEDIPDDWACPLCGVSKQDFDPYEGPSSGPVSARPVAHIPSVSRGRKGVVIVGGGLAGWSAARALRAKDPDVPITLIAADTADVYPKPALSLAFGNGKSAGTLITSYGADVADDLSVRLVPRVFATAIDASRRRLRTTRGNFDYDALVLAMGARPVEAKTLPSDLCWRINALDTWSRLQAVLADGPARITVVGAGLVGCELADDLAHAGHAVTVLDPAERPLAAWARIDESRRPLDGWRRLGMRFMPASSIVRVERRSIGGRSTVVIHCTDGAFHDADVVIAAIGLCLDTRLARSAGLAVDTGIAVDAATMATSVAGIYATGDCVSIDGKPCRFIEPIARQADALADAILGRPPATTAHKAPVIRLKTRSTPMTLGAGG